MKPISFPHLKYIINNLKLKDEYNDLVWGRILIFFMSILLLPSYNATNAQMFCIAFIYVQRSVIWTIYT